MMRKQPPSYQVQCSDGVVLQLTPVELDPWVAVSTHQGSIVLTTQFGLPVRSILFDTGYTCVTNKPVVVVFEPLRESILFPFSLLIGNEPQPLRFIMYLRDPDLFLPAGSLCKVKLASLRDIHVEGLYEPNSV